MLRGGASTPATWIHPASTLSIPGMVGNATRFLPLPSPIGFGAFAEAANSSEGDFAGNQLSIDAWVRSPNPNNLNTGVGIVEKIAYDGIPASSDGTGYIMFLNQGWLAFTFFDGTEQLPYGLAGSQAKVPPNTWAHVAVTVDRIANTIKFYVNGKLEGTSDISAVNGTLSNDANLKIGYAPGLNLQSPNAYDLNEIEIFDRILDQNEIESIYKAGSAGKCKGTVQDVAVTVNTAVNGTIVNVGLRIVVDGSTYVDSNSYTAPGGSQHTHSTKTQLAGGLFYSHTGWTPGTGTGPQTVTLPVSGSATYTANFDITGYEVTLNNSDTCSVGIGPLSLLVAAPPPFIMPLGVPFFVLAESGNPIGFTIATGSGPDVVHGAPPLQVGPFSGPITITPACGATVTSSYGANNLQAINVTLTNTGEVTATNLRVTEIANVMAASPNVVVFDQGVVGNPSLTFPWVWGDLPGGVATARTVGFKATSGSNSVPFTFDITFEADNMAPMTQTISVPFPR